MVLNFTKCILEERGQLSRIWLAAHWEKTLRRSQIFDIDIESCIQDIMSPEIILDLRMSGHLLVGVVKIFSRKAKYLLSDCNSILCKVKSFCPGIDLPDHKMMAPANEITIVGLHNFDHFNTAVTDELLSANQSRVEDITLKETYGTLKPLHEDDMTEFGYSEEDQALNFDDHDLIALLHNVDIIKDQTSYLTLTGKQHDVLNNKKQGIEVESGMETESNILKNGHTENLNHVGEYGERNMDDGFYTECSNSHIPDSDSEDNVTNELHINQNINGTKKKIMHFNQAKMDDFNLQPLKETGIVWNKQKRKRHLIIDQVKSISHEKIAQQIMNTADLITPLELAPVSKRLMILKEVGSAKELFLLPGLKIRNRKILNLFKRNLKTCKFEDNMAESEEEEEISEISCRQSDFTESRSMLLNGIKTDMSIELSSVNRKCSVAICSSSDDYPSCIDDPMDSISNTENFCQEFCAPQINRSAVENISDAYAAESLSFLDKFQNASPNDSGKRDYVFNDKTILMLQSLQLLFKKQFAVPFSFLIRDERRGKVAEKFFILLMLKKFLILYLEQSEPYDEIFISKGRNFLSVYAKYCNVQVLS